MLRSPTRTLDDGERRKIAARMLAVTARRPMPEEGPPANRRRRRQGDGQAKLGGGAVRLLQGRGAPQARRLERLLLDPLERLRFPAVFCAAAAAWGVALALVLGCLGVVGD